ncbi:methylenetetrahydrofolate reductase [Pseudorhodoplanes sp.]|uniref:methylenetetrahydrofolate reductase n=1 Tax=Pseudorhodoplanes sp. TaxID=1934341 RepID=UPI002B708FC1|nr:methylenetetrahydrofolate reductase [Pseudorhodoplanes sp.]HWV55767.1 methylenetetrahydrofolate reductase [Pseudorhodoplanes sp.]
MAAPLRKPSPRFDSETVDDIRAFLTDFSLEVTRPKLTDLEAIRDSAGAGIRVYVSAIPTRPSAELIEQSAMVRKVGLEPIPHIAVRNYTSRDELSGIIGRLASEAGVRHVLVISGDRGDSSGPFTASLEIIESGILQQHGITNVSIAGHPDGHPVVANDVMYRALLAKIEAAEQSGLTADIVTQFAFDANGITRWVMKMRDLGIEAPIRIGLAGPTNLTTLLKYAQRCGVKASIGGITKHAGLVKNLFGVSAPDSIVRVLAGENAAGSLGSVAVHYFSFGGVAATSKWAAHAAQGRFTLEGDGFTVEP